MKKAKKVKNKNKKNLKNKRNTTILMKKFPKLKGRAILSPMAGVTDVAFRSLARKYGAALTVTEFVNSIAINRGNEKTFDMLKTAPNEKPVAIQLFGNDEKELLESAKKISENKKTNFDIIDINVGCPAYKVIKIGCGSELLKDKAHLHRLISNLVDNINKPVTVKMRLGINDDKEAVEIAKIIEEAGASALAVHGRTQKQQYSGKANWQKIAEIKRNLQIPVIGNGDVFDQETFYKRLEESEVEYILIARGAIGYPKIFKEIVDKKDYDKTAESQIVDFEEYLKLAVKYKVPFSNIKTHALSFTKGLKGSNKLRSKMSGLKTNEELFRIMEESSK